MKNIIFMLVLSLFFYSAVSTSYSFEWPVKDPRIVSTFGSRAGKSYNKGIEIFSSSEAVSPIEAGEVVLRCSEYARGVHDLPSPLGNLTVLQHERGIQSIYGQLASPTMEDVPFYDITDQLGIIGSSGTIEAQLLYLQLIDSEVNRFVNPLLSLPSIGDTSEPQLKGVSLSSAKGSFPLENTTTIPQGRYELSINTFDESSAGGAVHRMAPYSIKVYINGEAKDSLSFESLTIRDWSAVPTAPPALEASQLYSRPWEFKLGDVTLQPGEAAVEVFVNDFSGNEAIQTYRIEVSAN
ncbi:MAG: hypothetical protein K9L66_08630 [Spirochaetaceae bacterium]|nr:hypothetical protein [Spirochaetaceae bacterium]MCF7947882.1 hypothetical protein [Spirochaetia bacterium]MCF7951558.1 hypothetical protein [Spirochaetaceae bacterium]